SAIQATPGGAQECANAERQESTCSADTGTVRAQTQGCINNEGARAGVVANASTHHGSIHGNAAGATRARLRASALWRDPRNVCAHAAHADATGLQVQREVIKAGWHRMTSGQGKGRVNILRYQVMGRGGASVGRLAAVVLAEPDRWVLPVPPANPVLKLE
ncbi:hypothetical protein, partial [Acidovorax sp. SUPP1855]|uniref:hypothetical protein n=1 Tax=Acidovorax sp. SUPP1855 TaxID=431774 RepID=UPI0024E15A8D